MYLHKNYILIPLRILALWSAVMYLQTWFLIIRMLLHYVKALFSLLKISKLENAVSGVTGQKPGHVNFLDFLAQTLTWIEKRISTPTMIHTAWKMKFIIKDFFSKCDQIRRKLQIWSHLLKKSLMENFIFCTVTFLTIDSDLIMKYKQDIRFHYGNCVKSVQIEVFSGPYIPVFSSNTGKFGPGKTPYLDTFPLCHLKFNIYSYQKVWFNFLLLSITC